MAVDEDLAVMEKQEELLRWEAFDADTAWRLGCAVRELLAATGPGGTVEIEIGGHLLFESATMGAKPDQANWIRRKRNIVKRFERSSYAVGRMLARDGDTLEAKHGLAVVDYAPHGGGFPIWVQGQCVGTVIVSGLPQRDDHNVAVEAVAKVLGVKAPMLG